LLGGLVAVLIENDDYLKNLAENDAGSKSLIEFRSLVWFLGFVRDSVPESVDQSFCTKAAEHFRDVSFDFTFERLLALLKTPSSIFCHAKWNFEMLTFGSDCTDYGFYCPGVRDPLRFGISGLRKPGAAHIVGPDLDLLRLICPMTAFPCHAVLTGALD
jgi:hypothetical protein